MEVKKIMRIKTNLIGLSTIIRDEIKRFLRIWPQTIVASALTVTLYFVIFSNLDNTSIRTTYNISYLQYITPGLIMMAIITNSYGNVAFSLWNHRVQHSIEEVLIAPIPHYLILIGYTFGGVIRGLLVGGIVGLISTCFAQLNTAHLAFSIVIAIMTAGLFALAGFSSALLADKFDDILLIPNFLLVPLIYLGGVFYSINQLTPFWQSVSRFNPILYVINLFRYALLNISDVSVSLGLAAMTSVMILLFIFNLALLKRGIHNVA